eukprot:gene4038-biopygen4469
MNPSMEISGSSGNQPEGRPGPEIGGPPGPAGAAGGLAAVQSPIRDFRYTSLGGVRDIVLACALRPAYTAPAWGDPRLPGAPRGAVALAPGVGARVCEVVRRRVDSFPLEGIHVTRLAPLAPGESKESV